MKIQLTVCAVLLCAATAALAAHELGPVTSTDTTTGALTSLWLADRTDLGNPVMQLTNQPLDGAVNNTPVFYEWTYDATRREDVALTPALIVYGVSGQLFSASLKAVGPVQRFSSGVYHELCSLTAIGGKSFVAGSSYVMAVVAPEATDSCAAGTTQTWLIPANAGATTPPLLEPPNWTVLGAFTDPVTDQFLRYIVWTGTELDSTNASFGGATRISAALPAGPAPFLVGRVGIDGYALATSVAGTIETDTYYHFNPTGAAPAATFSYSTSSPCSGVIGDALTDVAGSSLIFSEPTPTGFGIFTLPMSGGALHQASSDSSGNCGGPIGDAPSKGRVAILSGPAVYTIDPLANPDQTPVQLGGDGVTNFAFVRYTAGGHFWIQIQSIGPASSFTLLVVDGDGTVIANLPSARVADDVFAGISPRGTSPVVDRSNILVESPVSVTGCATNASLVSLDATTLAPTPIFVPMPFCRVLFFGAGPVLEGTVTTATGTALGQLDTATNQVTLLLGPQSNLFSSLSGLAPYPFY
jgi:hypothetical protein